MWWFNTAEPCTILFYPEEAVAVGVGADPFAVVSVPAAAVITAAAEKFAGLIIVSSSSFGNSAPDLATDCTGDSAGETQDMLSIALSSSESIDMSSGFCEIPDFSLQGGGDFGGSGGERISLDKVEGTGPEPGRVKGAVSAAISACAVWFAGCSCEWSRVYCPGCTGVLWLGAGVVPYCCTNCCDQLEKVSDPCALGIGCGAV